MAIYKEDIADIELENGEIHRHFLMRTIGSGDKDANRFGIRVFRNGVAENLSGANCQAIFMNANGENIALTSYGTVSGNLAYVTLPQACYNVNGQFTLAIKLVGGGVTGTMRIVDGVVDNTGTVGTIAPTGSVPTYQEILAVYDQMQEALTTVENLKSVVDAGRISTENDIEQITGNRALIFQKGQYRVYGDNTVVDLSEPVTDTATSARMVCAKSPCVPGDVFTIRARGKASSAAAYGFYDAAFRGIRRNGVNELVNGTVKAPANAAWFAVNNDIVDNPNDYYAYKGENVPKRFSDMDNTDSLIQELIGCKIIPMIAGKRIMTDQFPIDITDFDTSTGFDCAVVPCEEGDRFYITGKGGTSSAYLYSFVDSNGNKIKTASSGDEVHDLILTTPENAAYLVCNFLKSHEHKLFKDIEWYGRLCKMLMNEGVVNDEIIDNSDGDTTLGQNYIFRNTSENRQNYMIQIRAKWTGTGIPTMAASGQDWFEDGQSRHLYVQTIDLGSEENRFYNRTIRVAPMTDYGNTTNRYLRLRFLVPAGTVLYIKDLFVVHDNAINRDADCGVNLCAHGYCGCGKPTNTMLAFNGAAQLGFKYCITIPKKTADNPPVYVCLHDDGGISATARNDDGTTIDPEYNVPIGQLTYNQLMQFDFGIYKSKEYAGERIPKLDDFFRLCATTGMHPMLSVHATPDLDRTDWANIKAMAEKYGILKNLNIKGGATKLDVPMNVLKHDVESYTLDWNTGYANASQAVSGFDNLITNYLDGERKDVRFIIENMRESRIFTQEMVDTIRDGGYEAGRANFDQDTLELQECVGMGVTWFTTDHAPFVGLGWM